MEGYLSMWTGVLSQWRKFYFILHNDIITFCNQRGGEKQGSIHLKVASIVSAIDDPLKINIHTGTHILFIRADTINLRIEWMKAFAAAQHDIFNQDLSLQMRKLQSDGTRGYQAVDKRIKNLDSLVAELWNSQAEFEDLMTQLLPRLQRNNTSIRLCQKIVQVTNNIKYKTSDAISAIQQMKTSYRQKPTSIRQEYSDMHQGKRKLSNNYNQLIPPLFPFPQKNNSNSFGSIDQYRSFDKGQESVGYPNNISMEQYHSFDKIGGRSLQRINEVQNQSDYRSFDRIEPPVSVKLLKKISQEGDYSSFHEFGKNPITTIPSVTKNKSNPYNMDDKCSHNFKNNLVNRNLVFIQYPISRQSYRTSLPVSVSPELKIKILSILKDSIGADLTKISLPVSLNEPLSILQKGAEQMFYSSLLDDANKMEQPIDRLLYVVAFAVSQYSLTINKTKKPFNPLLGQTYQFIDDRRRFKFLSEQVSHHPPISAMQCSSDNFQFFANSKGSTNFRGASIKMVPESSIRIKLKKNHDTVVYNKCTTSLNNLIVGNLYVDNFGDVAFKMYSTGRIIATADIKFSECSMWGNTQYKVSGTVRDKKGKEYKVDGRWNQSLSYTDVNLGITKEIWSLTHKSIAQNYYFNQLAVNLNNLNYQLLDLVAPTDSRLRPDQRALQYGNNDLAATQKQRLQQQQRQRRKTMQSKNEHHQPLWFSQVFIEQSGEREWVSNCKYWEERKLQNWTDSPQIF